MSDKGSKQVFNNMIWRFLERFGAQIVALVVSMVLARILDPAVYGTIALITVITTVLQVFVDSGLGIALIQKKDADDLDFSSVFYFNVAICAILYFLVFIAAPVIADFYEQPQIVPVIRVLSLTLVISGVKNIQEAYVSRNMMFKKFFFATLGGTIGAAVVGIIMALIGAGVWALVAQHLFNLIVDTCILWFTVKWRPKRLFSWERLKTLLSFGWKLLMCSLIDVVYNNVRSLIIGKKYTTSDLAFYNRSDQLTYFLIGNVNSAINSVMLPTLSTHQDKIDEVRDITRKAIQVGVFCIAPMLLGFSACADSFISLVLTDKWNFCVPYIRVFCITYIFYPIASTNISAYKAIGKSGLYLKVDVLQKMMGFIILLATMWFGPMIMAYSLIVVSISSFSIRAYYNKKYLMYSIKDQVKDVMANVYLAIIMFAVVYPIHFINIPRIIVMIIQIIVGGIFYVVASELLHIESYKYAKQLVLPKLIKKR